MLTKTRRLVTIENADADHAFYVDGDNADEPSRTVVGIDRQAYDDMGRPAVVTVTVEPGDLLN